MDLYAFFRKASEQNWRMNWASWCLLIQVQPEGYFVADNDSGCEADDILDADDAKIAFFKCTLGPATHCHTRHRDRTTEALVS